jgi:hypothetical protein
MAARLKRLEGMVRGIVELEGAVGGDGSGAGDSIQKQHAVGSVVHSEKATNYVGGTHFMAILEDVSILNSSFALHPLPGYQLNTLSA